MRTAGRQHAGGTAAAVRLRRPHDILIVDYVATAGAQEADKVCTIEPSVSPRNNSPSTTARFRSSRLVSAHSLCTKPTIAAFLFDVVASNVHMSGRRG
jgi:hypothetical protein